MPMVEIFCRAFRKNNKMIALYQITNFKIFDLFLSGQHLLRSLRKPIAMIRRKLTRIFTTILLSSIVFSAYSQSLPNGQEAKYNPVLTAVPFLTISPDARHSAMGDAGVATSPDANAQHWNPSKYLFVQDQFGVSLSYTPWLRDLVDGINMAYLAGYYRIDNNQVIGSSFRYFAMGDIKLVDQSGTFQNMVSPNEFAFDVSYSRRLSENWSGGVAFRYIRSDLFSGLTAEANEAMSSFAADISFFRTKSWMSENNKNRSLAYGINISNIGGKMDDELFLPTNLRLGTSFATDLSTNHMLSFSLDLNKLLVPTPSQSIETDSEGGIIILPNDNSNQSAIGGIFSSFGDAPGGFKEEMQEINIGLGAEYTYHQQFSLRMGYFYENEFKGNRNFVTTGVGMKLKSFAIDLSYIIPTINNSPMANTFRFSLLMNIDTFSR